MKRQLVCLLFSVAVLPMMAASLFAVEGGDGVHVQMRDVFAAMPDSVMPLVSKNNRLDCIDFIENQMEARVRNRFDEYVTLEALTSDYARFRTSSAAVLEMKLLPHVPDSLLADSVLLCLVTTAETGEEGSSLRLEDSSVRFLTTDWQPLPIAVRMDLPPLDSFFTSVDASSEHARRSLNALHPLRMKLAPEDCTMTLFLQTALLTTEEKESVRECLHPVMLRWDGRCFMLDDEQSSGDRCASVPF